MASRQLDEEEIFHVARQIPSPDARSTYLDQICAGDQALRERVESLLAVHEKEKDFLQSSPEPAPTVDQSPLTERPGSTIGRYRLMEQVGEGGMGVVFVAEQERPVRRKVALKIIKPGMDTKEVVARFEAERQALALMDHPNIAKVLDAGSTESGRPYFVMELVRGIPITEYCDQNKLPIRERLELFIQVCQAIQHAHQKGIIHRDVKPSNVLVTLHDGKPVPKIIDFGVAKATNQRLTERTIYTRLAQIIGTPMYMSPEQAELNGLDVDTRSDIYSLGVLLYELLTGTTPFDKERFERAAYDEIRRIVRQEEPPKPSTKIGTLGETATAVSLRRQTDPQGLRRAVRGDLDWIVMKALEKDRARRYETANGLGADLRRFLSDEPIEARPPSAVYRVVKFVRRNKGAVAAATFLVVALVAAIVGTTSAWFIVSRKNEQLNTQLYQRVLNEALLGGADADALIAEAEYCQLPRPKMEVLRGLRAFYAGQLKEAHDHLQQAEPSVAAQALSAWVFSVSGDNNQFAETAVSLLDADPETPEDWLLLGQLHSLVVPEKALTMIERGMRHREASVLAHTIHAMALANAGIESGNWGNVSRAVDEVKAARVFKPNNTFVLSAYLHVHHVAYRAANLRGDKHFAASLLAEAEHAANELSRTPTRYVMYDCAFFLSDMARDNEAMEAWRECLKPGQMGFTPMIFAPISCYFNRRDEAIQHLVSLKASNDTFTQIALATLQTDDPNKRKDVLRCYTEIVDRDTSCDARIFALHLLLMLGEGERARQEARRLLASSIELIIPYRSHIEFLAGGAEEDLLVVSPKRGHFEIGLKAYADGDHKKAREHFLKCTEGGFVSAQFWWSKVYLNRIDEKAKAS